MIPYLGDFVEDDVVYMMFNTFTSDDPSASCTITNLANTDVHIHKDDGLTQRNNAAGITVSVNFDGITGSHLLKIDTNDNTVAGFWVTGSDYFVRIEGTTIDGATINAVVGHFSIENRFMRGTDSAALATTALSNATWTNAKSVVLSDWMNGERLDLLLDACLGDTDELQTNQGAWATATGFSTHNAANVWTVAARVLTANTNFNDLDAAAIKAEVAAALQDIKLDHLLNIAVDTNWATTVHLDSVIGHMADVGTAATFNRTTDALEALRNRGDAAWIAATGFSTHSAADVKTVIEAAGSSIALMLADTNELQTDWANGGRLDLLIDAILTDTGTTLDAKLDTILGLGQENFYIDTTTYDGTNMTGARVRIYSVAGSVGGAGDVIATYTMTATYTGSEMDTYKVVKS